MGYTTEFDGSVSITPPLNQEEIDFLVKFNGTRRMARKNGPYFVDGTGFMGQGNDEDVINHNSPPDGQPSLWCNWVPTDDGTALEWDGGEKFYNSSDWMTYIIDHFLKPGCHASSQLPFLQANHTINGVINAQGEDSNDRWQLVVEGNVVSVRHGVVTYV